MSMRVAAHVHSSWSYDARWSLKEIADAFRRRHYDVVLMSEHDRNFNERKWCEYQYACQDASTDGILLIPGVEYEDSDGVVHIPVWGDKIPFLGSGKPTIELLRCARAENAIAVHAHPWRRNIISRYRPEWAPLLSGIEIWNRKYDGITPNKDLKHFGVRERIDPFVSLDFHTRRQFFPLAMSISLKEEPSSASIVTAIRDGHCKPEFFGMSALRFTKGIEGWSLSFLEGGSRCPGGSLSMPVNAVMGSGT